jgi:hypothetical protein
MPFAGMTEGSERLVANVQASGTSRAPFGPETGADRIFSERIVDKSVMDYIAPYQMTYALVLSVGVGFLACFLGHRILRVLIALTGFLLAGAAGAAMAGVVMPENGAAVLGAGTLAGLAGALALLFAYRAGVFVLGALGGGLVAYGALLGAAEPWVLAAVAGAGLAGGLFALVLERPLMIGATAVLGAWVVLTGSLMLLIGQDYLPPADALLEQPYARWTLLAIWGLFSLAGMVTQAGPARKRERRVFAPRPS